MEDKVGTFNVGDARLYLLIMAEAVVEKLGHTCGVREEQLFELAICGWTEEAFLLDAYGWYDDHA